ncbi:MAG: hypothetical protein JWO88_3925 [Frankiales bacterium]|nr:hypothetical protein [Frankiales bacterium]
MPHTPNPKPSHPRFRRCLTPLVAVGSLLLAPLAHAGDHTKDMTKSVVEPEPEGAKINLLLNVEFSDKYVTPRGQVVRDDGLSIQPLMLAFINLYEGKGFIDSFKVFGGFWADYGTKGVSEHAPFGSQPKTHYTEIDPILGVSMGFAKLATLSVTYSAFVEQILDIETSHNLEVKLAFDDSKFLGPFALHPYFLYWQELQGKSTAARVPFAVFGKSLNTGSDVAPNEGYYFEIGVDPGYTFKPLADLKIEFPCRVLLPSDDFYGQFYDDTSTVGLYEVGVKLSIPLNFMPKGYGHWSIHAGYKYMNFVDENLEAMNQFNAPGKKTEDIHQVYGGISVFF